MRNEEIAAIFDEIADLLEIKGEQVFRINSYRRAARTVSDLTRDIAEVAAAGELETLQGIGKSTAEKINEYLASGRMKTHAELLESVPKGLPGLLKIAGMGPKRVALVWKELGVTNLDELKETISSGRFAALKGMGTKSVEQIAAAIQFVEKSTGRTPLGLAWPLAEEMAAELRKVKAVRRVSICGSLRRGCETIGDLDLLCESADGPAVIKAFTALPQVKRVLAAGDTKSSVIVLRRDSVEMQADCRVVPAESFGSALQYFTGSKAHNVRLREIASRKNWKLNEWGLFAGPRRLAGKDEPAIYKKLGLPPIPPEQREDRGEFEAGAIEPLIDLPDLRGDLHVHTSASDGVVDAEEIARAAEDLGYHYISINDHSKSSAIANGLSVDRMWRQIEKLRTLNKKLKSIAVLVSCECDILSDGSLDYPDQVLAACDLVVASVHSGMRQSRDKITARVLRAMENPYVTILGHPTGRLIGQREAMDLDMEAVIAKAAETGTALELNASWQRLDLHDRHARMARDAGVMICISTDAHSVSQLGQMKFGVITARRAWLRPQDILNTRPLPAVRKWIARKRKQA
ncbi:MAG TPA: DNA polymerase/3'-5' exonuclease PolX [Phycisphaerae bacterium]|nr:DNA polymerase/3'-5' exonuclease PolX [Phycisphaerae bacterium]